MLLLKLFIVIVLLTIFLQDLKDRLVLWLLFPILALALLVLKIMAGHGMVDCFVDMLINLGFLFVQLLLLSAYISVKQKRWSLLHVKLIGLGDVLFLVSTAFYPALASFLLFYVVSLVIALALWLVWQALAERKSNAVPLAGLQAMVFILFLSTDWWGNLIDLTNDSWLVNLIAK